MLWYCLFCINFVMNIRICWIYCCCNAISSLISFMFSYWSLLGCLYFILLLFWLKFCHLKILFSLSSHVSSLRYLSQCFWLLAIFFTRRFLSASKFFSFFTFTECFWCLQPHFRCDSDFFSAFSGLSIFSFSM